MLNEPLLPCPFCGASGDKLVRATTQATYGLAWWSVECTGCGVEVADDASQDAADHHWNTRTPPPTPPSDEARAREVLEATFGPYDFLELESGSYVSVDTAIAAMLAFAHPAQAGEDAR